MSFWENNRTHIITIGGLAVFMAAGSAPWWYRFSQNIDTIGAAKVVYNCFCKTMLDAAAEGCQGALDRLYGAGLAPSNVTIFCASSGSLAHVKSEAIKAAVGNSLAAAIMVTGGAILIGKYIRDVRRLQSGYRDIA